MPYNMDPNLESYLKQEIERKKRRTAPYLEGPEVRDADGEIIGGVEAYPRYTQNIERDAYRDLSRGMDQRALGSALMDSASQIGTLGGKRADASTVSKLAEKLDRSSAEDMSAIEQKRGAREAENDKLLKMYQYIADKKEAGTRADKDFEERRRHNKAMEARYLRGAEPPKKEEPTDLRGRLNKLNTTEKQRLDSVAMGLDAANDMDAALRKGDWTISLGDNDYTFARSRFEEALGRMQSGGAINIDEAAKFRKMAPGPLDTAKMQQEKMQWVIGEMRSRLGTLGFDPDEFLLYRSSLRQPKAPQPSAATPPSGAPAPVVKYSAEDTQALSWLAANPTHPKASEVKARLIKKGLIKDAAAQ